MTRSAFFLTMLVLVAGSSLAMNARAAERLVLLPQKFELSTRESRQRLDLAGNRPRRSRTPGDRQGFVVVRAIPNVATVVDGLVMPAHDGQATITAKVGDQTATAQVVVSGMTKPFERSFRNHVEPMLAKLGCNSGACHGALAGKGGFRLSLRGYDPAMDYFNIVKQDRGRRVELSDPGRSLVLAKPSGAIAHKGGIRFATSSLDYRILAEWLSCGRCTPQGR